jgi:hypothetical protein
VTVPITDADLARLDARAADARPGRTVLCVLAVDLRGTVARLRAAEAEVLELRRMISNNDNGREWIGGAK